METFGRPDVYDTEFGLHGMVTRQSDPVLVESGESSEDGIVCHREVVYDLHREDPVAFNLLCEMAEDPDFPAPIPVEYWMDWMECGLLLSNATIHPDALSAIADISRR